LRTRLKIYLNENFKEMMIRRFGWLTFFRNAFWWSMFGSMASFRKYAVDQRERQMFFVVVAPVVVFWTLFLFGHVDDFWTLFIFGHVVFLDAIYFRSRGVFRHYLFSVTWCF